MKEVQEKYEKKTEKAKAKTLPQKHFPIHRQLSPSNFWKNEEQKEEIL